MRTLVIIAAMLALTWAPARATVLYLGPDKAKPVTIDFVGTALSPIDVPGIAGTNVTFSFLAPRMPAAGKCVTTQRLVGYNDGQRTLPSLKAAGFKFVYSNSNNNAIRVDAVTGTHATVCVSTTGIVSGTYLLYALASNAVTTVEYVVSDANPGGVDTVLYELYVGGDVPQIYGLQSSGPGTWSIVP